LGVWRSKQKSIKGKDWFEKESNLKEAQTDLDWKISMC
jgi:hypothetical protein